MIRRLIWICLLIVAACTPAAITTENNVNYTAPIPMTVGEIEFISSDVVVSWDWPALNDNQIFALRVWYEEDTPQEVWLAESEAHIQDMIDSYSRDVGDFHWQVAVVNTSDDGGFDTMGSEWSPVITLHRVRRFTLDPLPPELQSDMARYILAQGFTSQFELVNFTRDFVHQHTNITTQADYGADFGDAMQEVFNHARGEGDAPELYCDGMSTGMLTVFHESGIESRLVFLYGQASGWYSQHTFLEVFNSDTQQWEVHDPTFNRYFVDTVTGERASANRMVFGDLDTLAACDTDGTCSRQALSDSVEAYLGAFRTGHSVDEVWINPNRMNISTRNSGQENNNFPEFISRMTGIPQRQLIFRFDTWEALPDIVEQ